MPFDGDLSCPDWEKYLQAGKTPIVDLPINEKLAGAAVRCFDQLRLPDVIGQPRFGDVGGQWFRDIIRALFGCVDPDTSIRHINELFLLVPKKNSKTTNSAALGIVALLLNEVPNAQMQIIGPTQKVAETCLGQCQGMIDADSKLKQILHVQEHRSRIKHRITGAVLAIKTFDMSVVTGSIPIFTIIDELHLMSSKSYAKKVIGQIRGGMNKVNCLLVFITTQSAEEPSGVFRTELVNARAVRDGLIDSEGVLAVLYEFPEAMQTDKSKPWLNPKFWPMVLPNLGKSIRIEWLERELRKSQRKGAEDTQLWLSQHLNIQIGLGLHSDRWIGADYWEDTGQPDLTLDQIIETSEVCVVGVDGGGLDDLLGLAVIGRHKDTKVWQLWCRAWVDEKVLEERKSIAERLQDFDDLIIVDDACSDLSEIGEICKRLNDADLLPEKNAIGLDPEGVSDILDVLIEHEIEDDQYCPVSQGYKLNSAINGTPRKLKRGTLVHGDQPLMRWCVGNAKTELKGNARVVTKQQSGTAKIDPLMAAFNAVTLMSYNPQPPARRNLDAFLSSPVMVV